MPLRASDVAGALGLGDEHRAWLVELESLPPAGRLLLPTADELGSLAVRLRIPADDRAPLAAARPSPESEPELWWLLARCHASLTQGLGALRPLRRWPLLPGSLGARARYFYAWVFLAALADVRAWHAGRGIDDEVSWATLADLGQQMSLHRWLYGTGGLAAVFWLTILFRGILFRLGRLQFNRSLILPETFVGPLLWYDAATVERLGAGFRAGDHTLGVHIPAGAPLAPEACDESFRRARTFFDRHFPEEPWRVAICTSWLLDEQLVEHLGPSSNIIAFQRRFTLVPGATSADSDIFRFVFGKVAPPDIDALPQRTTLERSLVAHLRAGRHWQTRTGWIEL
jgi:hypothetical protein